MADFFLFLQTHMGFTLIWGGVLGVVFGSFLNVVILRWPKRMEMDWQSQAREILGLEAPDTAEAGPAPGIHEHSRCPHCQTPIRWFDNIPVLSYLFLRGKCRQCKASISFQYPAVEILACLGTLWMIHIWGVSWTALMGSGFWMVLLTLSVIDLRTMLLPDELVYVLLWAGLLGSALGLPGLPSLPQAVFGAAAGYLVLWTVYWLFKLIRGKEGMGYGDFKLLAALGAWCGAAGVLPIIVIATGTSLLIALIVWLSRRDATVASPFGPSLAVGGVITWLFPHWIDIPMAFLRQHPLSLALVQ